MEQLSLFGDIEPRKEEKVEVKPQEITSSVPTMAKSLLPYHEFILNEVKAGLSVKQICQKLINEKGLSSETYSQGTPKLYPQLMIYLSHQENVKLDKIDPNGNGDFIDYQKEDSGRKFDAIFKVL